MILQTLSPKTVSRPVATILDVFNGESNSGGQALISDLPVNMIGYRSPMILNNQTLLFEHLNIGVNNLMQHFGMPGYPWGPFIYHGWEAGIADMVDDGTMRANTSIVKTGQGGSTIYWWLKDSPAFTVYQYWAKMKERIDAAITIFNPTGTKFRLWYTQGINDAIGSGGTDPATIALWKSRTKQHFTEMRTEWGMFPIVMTKIPTTVPGYTDYNTAITEICGELSNCWFVEVSDLPMQDANHWNSSGMRTMARRMYAKFSENGFGN